MDVAAPIVVGNEEHRFLVLDQLREARCEPSALILEPVGHNTAPALTLAALQAVQDGRDPVLVVTPADHPRAIARRRAKPVFPRKQAIQERVPQGQRDIPAWMQDPDD